MTDGLAHDIVILIVVFTCVGLFVATAIASALDMFNLLRLQPDIRKKLHLVLVVEVVGICVTAFSGYINPTAVVAKAATLQQDKVSSTVGYNLLQAATERSSSDSKSAVNSAELRSIQVAAENARAASLERVRVLWVNDNLHDDTYERNALMQLGVQFVFAENTADALDLLDREKVQLVVTDFARKDDAQGGYTLLAEIRKLDKPPPVIIYSNSVTLEHVAEAKRQGAVGETDRPQVLFGLVVEALQSG